MLAIGRALMSRPRLLLLDEPGLGLAPLLVKAIFQTIREINRAGVTVVLVEAMQMVVVFLPAEFIQISAGLSYPLYLAVVLRGLMIAHRAETVFDTLLAVGCSAQIGLQTFVIVGGNIKLIPLTGVTLPLISYGGTSLLSSLCVIGLLQGVAARVEAGVRRDRTLAGLDGEGGAGT